MDKVPIIFSDLDELWLAQPIVCGLRYYVLVHGLVFLTLEYFVFWWDLHAVGFVVPRLWSHLLFLAILIGLLFCILLDASLPSLRQLYLLVILMGSFSLTIIVLDWCWALCRYITLILLGIINRYLFELIFSTWRTSATSSHVDGYRILILILLCPVFHHFYLFFLIEIWIYYK